MLNLELQLEFILFYGSSDGFVFSPGVTALDLFSAQWLLNA